METIEQQLNSEINSVQELLLMEAKSIVEKKYSDEEIKVIEDLASLGFTRNKEYIDYEDWKRAKNVNKYAEAYPMHKFITEGAVKKICKKYGLLLADVGDYKSDIPFENQKAIVNFRVSDEHLESSYYSGLINFEWMQRAMMPRMTWVDGQIVVERNEDTITAIDMAKKPQFSKAKNLKIIAPPSKLKMEGKKIKGHCLIDKDPIVLQPVKDGYLIVTAWGFEAKDSEVQNPRHN